ncbi:MAG: DinB family protein [Bacteroidetes bacterium]|nr:DinB family protein [Bacteroidota bacterium]
MRPSPQEYIAYYDHYIKLVPETEVVEALQNNEKQIVEALQQIPIEKADYQYASGKWTIKQVLNHINDTERIFSYRALRFSRGDAQQVLGFDQDAYAAKAPLNSSIDLKFLISEFTAIRQSTLLQFMQLSDKEKAYKGHTAKGEVSVLALGYLVCGHATHHINVLKEKYLK